MTERIKSLRARSLQEKPYISPERARLVTGFYKGSWSRTISAPMLRAGAFYHLLENKALFIGEGELIVGERGPAPKATPTYPEITAHSLEDLHILNSRPKTSYRVDEETQRLYREEVLPFWQGRTVRDRLFQEMDEEWKACFEAGLFTEFMEQRAPGHTVLDDKIYRKGFLEFKREIEERIAALDFYSDPQAYAKREELRAMSLCCDALVLHARRYAEKARQLASREGDPERKRDLERIAENCAHVPAHPPRDFWEALQAYWFVHLGVIIELNTWDSFNPGRLDQHLYPYYQRGLKGGTLTGAAARELLQAFWIKFNNQPAPPKVGVTAQESGTYADFALINIGGLTARGEDAVNELSYLILEVIEEMRMIQPSGMVQISKKNPDRFLKAAIRVVKSGFGQPSIFNSDAIVQELVRQGKRIEDARNGGASGCVETGTFGKENYNLTGYFNLTKVLEITLHNGIDPRTGKRLGPESGDPRTFQHYEELWSAFEQQLRHFIDIKIRGNNIVERIYAEHMPTPFLSILVDDCIASGRDYHDGGARYNTSYIMAVGLATISDCLSSIRYNVYDQKQVSMAEMLEALGRNFEGHESLKQRFLNRTPKYGNDDEYADTQMREVFDAYFQAINGRPTTKGGTYQVSFFPTTCHVYFGSVIGATPDGRLAGEPLSEGISPVQGSDRFGPAAVIKSAAKMDHLRTGGTLLNQKLTPQLLADEEGIDKLAQLVRSYFKLDGHHLQFNVITAATLKAAKKNPQRYRDLIVRVAGYSDYFVDLSEELQDEIIRRTEQHSF